MANSYLSHTTSTPTNSDKATLSFWLKRSLLSSGRGVFAEDTNGTNKFAFILGSNNTISIFQETAGTVDINLVTNRLFRDASAWYHIVVAYDSSQGSASDRVKLYVNGSQETSFSTSTYPSSNVDFRFNKSGIAQEIGRYEGGNYFDGYLSHVAFVDGQQLAPTVFGETDSTSGIWKFKSPSGVTWGNNGFWLKFENSGALGTDSSGNSNTFTVNGNGRQALDTPSNVHATWNPLAKLYNGTYTFTNGNTTCEVNVRRGTHSTLGASSGKFYWETKLISNNNTNNNATGISAKHSTAGNDGTGEAAEEYIYKSDGQKTSNNTSSSYGNSYTNGDIIGVAMDLDNNKLYFSKNGTWQNSGVPTSGSTGTGAISITAADSTTDGFYVANAGNENDTAKWSANFGNGYFGTTAISSAGSNGNGSLFEYDVPSGYYALNTKNINTYG